MKLTALLLCAFALVGCSSKPTVVAASGAAPAKVARPPLEFRGVAPGMTLEDFRQRNRSVPCRPAKQNTTDCTTGSGVRFQIAEFVDGKLASADWWFPTDDYSSIREALQEKYGDGEVEVKKYRNGFGSEYEGEVAFWRSGGIILEASQYRAKITTGSVLIIQTDLAVEYMRRNKKKADI